LASRFHTHLRTRPTHPTSPRPVMMNVWEAVYFEHRIETLTQLAELAADVGVELFVLDDGWFGGRRNDATGLGDWHVSEEVWGDGRLHEFVATLRARGMGFGLWF